MRVHLCAIIKNRTMKRQIVKSRILLLLLAGVLSINIGMAQTQPMSGEDTYISKFSFGVSTSNYSSGNNTYIFGYSDFTSIVLAARECETYSVRIKYSGIGMTPSNTIYDKSAIWIDFNDDASFHPSERVEFIKRQHTADSANFPMGVFQDELSDMIAMPSGSAGTHLMRVRYLEINSPFNADDNYAENGETEDYMIHIAPQNSNVQNPVLNTAGYADFEVSSLGTVQAGQTFSARILFDNYVFTKGYVQWYYTTSCTYPMTFIEINNSNDTAITFMMPTTGTITLWAMGTIGCTPDFFVARGTCINVVPAGGNQDYFNSKFLAEGYEPTTPVISLDNGNFGSNFVNGKFSNENPSLNQVKDVENNMNAERNYNSKADQAFNLDNSSIYQVYPVPFNTELNISMNQSSGFEYEIYSMQGKLIMQGKSNSNHSSMNVENFEPGIYSVRILEDGKYTSTKILKSR